MGKYTRDVHAENLIKMLELNDIPERCPSANDFSGLETPGKKYTNASEACEICKDFIGLDYGCPCGTLGYDRAIEYTMEALLTGGYINESNMRKMQEDHQGRQEEQ